jgi:hypothetical protein
MLRTGEADQVAGRMAENEEMDRVSKSFAFKCDRPKADAILNRGTRLLCPRDLNLGRIFSTVQATLKRFVSPRRASAFSTDDPSERRNRLKS